MHEERRWRVSKMEVKIEALVESGQTREAWIKIQMWYQQAKGHPTHHRREGMENP